MERQGKRESELFTDRKEKSDEEILFVGKEKFYFQMSVKRRLRWLFDFLRRFGEIISRM